MEHMPQTPKKNIYFVLNDEIVRNCKLMKKIRITREVEFWKKKSQRCETLMKRMAEKVFVNELGNVIYLQLSSHKCRASETVGKVYNCSEKSLDIIKKKRLKIEN